MHVAEQIVAGKILLCVVTLRDPSAELLVNRCGLIVKRYAVPVSLGMFGVIKDRSETYLP